ncbi:MAG: hypothetical protein IJM83_04065 [Firmicutes bacterium]|nr:hypothetical protein [Bacillota bacterium]
MSVIFLKILNMSITAGWLILAVVLTRFVLKKAPRWIMCLLWALVAIRLICPFSLESALSLIPSSETIPSNIEMQAQPAIDSGITVVNETVNPLIAQSFTPDPTNSANPLQILIPVISLVWIIGTTVMLLFALASYLRLKRSVAASVPAGESVTKRLTDDLLADLALPAGKLPRIRICDDIPAPFILGIFRPVIYVPSSLSDETLDYVIRHELAHLRRHDHWWKPLGFLLLAVYWFHPLCWIAYILLCRDIEMACDERVVRDMGKSDIAAYSQALLDCSMPRRTIAACPLAFGEGNVKTRIKSVLNYKKPAFWIIAAALVVCAALAVFLMTDPSGSQPLSEQLDASIVAAVKEQNRSSYSEGRFSTVDYRVLRISHSNKQTTVYAMALYEEYIFDGSDVIYESGSYIPVAIRYILRRFSALSGRRILGAP